MARAEPEDLEEVVDFDLTPTDVQAFIDDAHRVIQRRCAPYAGDSEQAELSTTEVYLAAHLLTSKSPQVSSTSAETMNVSYAIDPEGEDYWHRALLVDPTGRLARPDGWNVYSTHNEA